MQHDAAILTARDHDVTIDGFDGENVSNGAALWIMKMKSPERKINFKIAFYHSHKMHVCAVCVSQSKSSM